jgi:hypothetical protein
MQRSLSSWVRKTSAVLVFAKSMPDAEDSWHNWEHRKEDDGNSRHWDTFPGRRRVHKTSTHAGHRAHRFGQETKRSWPEDAGVVGKLPVEF